MSTRTCEDGDDLFEAGDLRGGKTCDWLRTSHDDLREWFCIPGTDAWNICQETCGKCNENCVDSETAVFDVADDTGVIVQRDCAWLDSTQEMQSQLCKAGHDAYLSCGRTCGTCTASLRSDENYQDIRDTIDKRPVRKDPLRH